MSALTQRNIKFDQRKVNQIVNHFSYVSEYLKTPTNEEENQKLIAFTRILKTSLQHQHNAEITELLDLIYKNINLYEKHAYPAEEQSPAEILEFLMQQHELTQSDLPEIGSQSHVSKILAGERNLTKEQIGKLAKRFGVSPAIFFHK